MNKLNGLQMVDTTRLGDYYTGRVLYKSYYRDEEGNARYKLREHQGLAIGWLRDDGMHIYIFDQGQINKLGKTTNHDA